MKPRNKSITPRQRAAIYHPIPSASAEPLHVRHVKRNGNIDSILTFDVMELGAITQMVKEDILNRSVEGWIGVWHARVSMHPARDLKAWNTPSTDRAKDIIMRLVAGVGFDHDIEVRNGSDMKSIHVHKWATPAEVCVANKAVPFIPEGPFMQNTVFACDLCLDRGWVSDENGEESRCPCPKGREFEGAQI